MNTDRIRQLADVIERQPHTPITAESGFNMGNWEHDCGNPACICGWANFVQNELNGTEHRIGSPVHARNWLGLEMEQASALFKPNGDSSYETWEEITPTHAAAVLRHLADTGRVDWSVGSST
jgi:hypothetical protein